MDSECSRSETSRLENLAWLVVPSLMAVAVLYLPVLLSQGPILRQDAVNATLPWWTFTRQELLAGRLPLWDPARLAGTPHVANIQAGVLYPPNWLFLPLPPEWAVYLSVVAHIALGGCLVAWFARSLGISPAYAGLAGLVFALSAQVSARAYAGHVQILQSLAWSPLLLLAAHQLGATGTRRAAGQLAAAAALSLLAGYPAVTVYSLGTAGVLFLAGLLRGERRLRAVSLLMMAGLLAGLMVTPAVWPLMELAGETTRSGSLPMEQAARDPMRPLHAPMLVWPWFFGAAPMRNNWPSPQVWFWQEAQGVGGLVVTLLAVAGLWARRRDRGFQALGLLALTSGLLALGTRTPAYTLLHELVAPLRSFRIPARFLLVWALVIPPLAAAGAQAVLERRTVSLRKLLLGGMLASAAALLVLAGLWLVAGDGGESSPSPWVADLWRLVRGPRDDVDLPRLASASAWGIANVVAGLVGLALLWAALQLRARGAWPLLAVYLTVLLELALIGTPGAYTGGLNSHEVVQRLGSSNLAILSRTEERVAIGMHYSRFSNAGDLFGFRSVTAWDPLLLARTTGLLRASQDFVDPYADASNEIFLNRDGGAAFDVLGVRYFMREDDGRPELLPRVSPLPRLTLVPSARLVGGPGESLRAVLAPGFEPRAEVILESPAPLVGTSRETRQAAGVAVLEAAPGRVRARVEATAESYLLFSESYYPGWGAEVGGVSVQPVPADHAIMAVRVPPGTHEVTFRFTAPWLPPTLALAVVGLGGLLLLWREGEPQPASGTAPAGVRRRF